MKKVTVGCRVSEEDYRLLRLLAIKENWSLSKLAEIAVLYYLKVRGMK